MSAILKKVDGFWTILVKRKDGTLDVYRFRDEEAAKHWAGLVGIEMLGVIRDNV